MAEKEIKMPKLARPISKRMFPRLRGYWENKLLPEAIEILKDRGFKESQIYVEFPTQVHVVDVVGISPEMTIAVECGHCCEEILALLEPYFDEVIWLSFPIPPSRRYYKSKA